MPRFHIRVAGDELVFSAGHFITLADGQCERLHGHSYRVAVEVEGPLDAHQCVIDFLVVRRALKSVLSELDHRMLLPSKHPSICVSSRSGEIEVTFANRRWVFPESDCLRLPVANTTTEMLAQHIGERLMALLAVPVSGAPIGLRVEVAEGGGAAAICELP